MEIRYQREIRHNYLIIGMEWRPDDFEMRMAEENNISGFLPFQAKEVGGKLECYYEITSRQPLSRMVERKEMRAEELRHLILGISAAVEEMERYLLGEEHILLEPEYIYIEPQNYTVSLCFVPGYMGNFPVAVCRLMEYLLGRISHEDREGVVLAYELFQVTKQENYGIRDLLKTLYQPEHTLDTPIPETNWFQESYAQQGRTETDFSMEEGNVEKKGLLTRLKRKKTEKIPEERRENTGFGPKELFRPKRPENSWQMVFPEDEYERVAEPPARYGMESQEGENTALLTEREPAERRLISVSGEGEISIPYFPFLIGKQEGLVDCVLPKDTVSRLHARIDKEGDGYTVTDLNSTNGVRVSGRLLQTNETASLPVGSEIYFADAGFLFL